MYLDPNNANILTNLLLQTDDWRDDNTDVEFAYEAAYRHMCYLTAFSVGKSRYLSIYEEINYIFDMFRFICIKTFRSLSFKVYSVSQKNPPYGFLKFFPKRLGIFNQFFTHILYEHFYTRPQIFIQLSPTLTKLSHTKHDHPTNFYISLEV